MKNKVGKGMAYTLQTYNVGGPIFWKVRRQPHPRVWFQVRNGVVGYIEDQLLRQIREHLEEQTKRKIKRYSRFVLIWRKMLESLKDWERNLGAAYSPSKPDEK